LRTNGNLARTSFSGGTAIRRAAPFFSKALVFSCTPPRENRCSDTQYGHDANTGIFLFKVQSEAFVAVIVTTFPRAVRVIDHILIPLQDGKMLAARIWLPDDANQNPVPAILEYLPYRKRDGTYERDALTHPYLAGHGYAAVRVDIRGSGESGGLLFDEYAKQEQDDGLEIIAWA
jgi:predicted acyl esterase